MAFARASSLRRHASNEAKTSLSKTGLLRAEAKGCPIAHIVQTPQVKEHVAEAGGKHRSASTGKTILGSGVFLVAFGTNVSTPFLVIYKERLTLGDSATMAIFTVYVLGIVSILPIAGQLSDRYGRRMVTVPFVLLSATSSIIMILGRDSFVLLLLGRFMLGVVSGAVLSISAAWMQELLGRGKEQRSALVTTVLTYAGFGAGPLVSAVILELDVWPLVLPYLLHATATAVLIPFLLVVPQSSERSQQPFRLNFGVPPEGRPVFTRIVAPAAIWVFAFPSTSFALFPVLVSDAIDGSAVWVAAMAAALTAWSGLSSRPLLPRLGPTRTLQVGMISGTLGYTLGTIAFETGAWGLVLPAAVFLGAASGLLTSGSLALLAGIADESNRGAINGTFYLLAYPGMAMPILLTSFARYVEQTPALMGVTALAALATVKILREPPLTTT